LVFKQKLDAHFATTVQMGRRLWHDMTDFPAWQTNAEYIELTSMSLNYIMSELSFNLLLWKTIADMFRTGLNSGESVKKSGLTMKRLSFGWRRLP
jgi:hypothetical protein